jgi:hypothetical protein
MLLEQIDGSTVASKRVRFAASTLDYGISFPSSSSREGSIMLVQDAQREVRTVFVGGFGGNWSRPRCGWRLPLSEPG